MSELPVARDAAVARDAKVALVAWVTARAAVLVAYVVSTRLFDRFGKGVRPVSFLQALLTYDADFYRAIAEHGYQRAGGGLRFFPLVPVATRALAVPFLGDHDVALVVLSNVAAFAFLLVLARVTRLETGDERVVVAAIWFGAVAPPAVVLVMGYAESALLLLSAAAFLFLRTARPGRAAAMGFLAGLARPFGLLLAIPAAIELVRGWPAATAASRARGVAAVVAPGAGVIAYLVWVEARFGDALLPMRIQQSSRLRGSFRDPVSGLVDAAAHGFEHPTGLVHLAAIALCGVLLWVSARRLPSSYTAFAGASVLVATSADNLDSFERYALGAFPLLVAAALLVPATVPRRVVAACSTAGLGVTAVAVFLGRWVP